MYSSVKLVCLVEGSDMFNDICVLLRFFFPLVNTICCHGDLVYWRYFLEN